MWSSQELKNHINVLELLSIKLTIQKFSNTLKHRVIHLQVDNMVALPYLLKIVRIQNSKLVQLVKLNVTADWKSINNLDSLELKLAQQLFQRICQLRGTPEKDLFASRLISLRLTINEDPIH